MKVRSVAVGVLAAVLVAGALSPLAAGDGTRELGGYRFVPAPRTDDPFIVTDFENSTGIAIASNVKVPVLVIPDDPPDTLVAIEGNFIYVIAGAGYQQRVGDRWALRIAGAGASRIGTSGQALLSQGVSVNYGGDLTAKVSLWSNDRTLVSGLAELGTSKALVIDFVQFAQDVIGGNYEDLSLVRSEWRTKFMGGASVARAFNRWSGIVATGKIGGATGKISGGLFAWRAGTAVSMDFAQRSTGGKPIGLVASLSLDKVQLLGESQSDITTAFGLGTFYTGQPDFLLGLNVQWARVKFPYQDVSAYPVSFSLGLRYLFL
jgi:hypothetical protein